MDRLSTGPVVMPNLTVEHLVFFIKTKYQKNKQGLLLFFGGGGAGGMGDGIGNN